jgi:PAS domain S-box-containing protein
VQEWNKSAERMFGYSRSQTLGQAMDELIVPFSLRQSYLSGITDYLITGVGSLLGRPIELEARRADTSQFPVELAITRIPGHEPPEYTVFIHDLTARKRAEEELRKSEEQYRMLVESVEDYAIYMLDPDGAVASWNSGAHANTGYSADEVMGQHYAIFLPPEADKKAAAGEMLEAAKIQGRHQDEGWRVRKNGSRYWAQVTFTSIRADSGELHGFSIVSHDVTTRKRAEEATKYLASIVRFADEAIIGKTTDGIITSWNPGAERLFGYSAEEAIDNSIQILVPGDRVNEEVDILDKVRRGESVTQLETIRKRKDGKLLHVSVTVSPIKDSKGRIVGASMIVRDVTEQRRAEEEIRRLNEELEHRVDERTSQLQAANKELEAFSYSVSHDLRAPLRHISGFAEMLETSAGARLDEEALRLLKTITDSAKKMGKLIDDLLAFSRWNRVELRKESVDLADLAAAVRHDLQPDAVGRDIQWVSGTLPRVIGDPALLRQVFYNLISNALKYTRPRPQAVIEISCQDTDSETVCSVRDNGVGFDMRYVDKLFGVFQRLHRASEFEGTGVGLANVRRIIFRHGGRTWAESQAGNGATFYFSLPKAGS